MNNKMLISSAICMILATIGVASSLALADAASDAAKKAERHFEKANELRKIDNHDGAIAEYEKAISLSPKSKIGWNAQYWIGQLYFKKGQLNPALSAFQKIIDEYPKSTIISSTKLMIERVQEAKKNKSLLEVVRDGDIGHLKELMSQGADINAGEVRGWSAWSGRRFPIHVATGMGHTDIVKLLIESGADLSARWGGPRWGWSGTPLHNAVFAGHADIVRLLIKSGADVNARERYHNGRTPLHTAVNVANRDVSKPLRDDIIKLLIDNGADVNVALRRVGTTPLQAAARKGNVRIVELLLSRVADINAKDSSGHTALHMAMGSDHREMVELLAAKGARASALHLAAYLGDTEKLRKLLRDGDDIDSRDEPGFTALHYAALSGKKEVVEFLIDEGARVDAKDSSNLTPLFYAAKNVHRDIFDLLMDKGADVNATGEKGRTLLISAIIQDDKDAVELLIDKGAKVDANDAEGNTPLMHAAWKNNKDVMQLLIDKGADVNHRGKYNYPVIIKAMWESGDDVIKLLIDNGADVNAKDGEGYSVYFWAHNDLRPKIAELLADRGATVVPSLHLAALKGDLDEVKRFVEEGADINKRDGYSATPLRKAVRWGKVKTAEFLIDKGADVDEDGGALLSLALRRGGKDTVDMLIAKGADLNIRDKSGNTPLHSAATLHSTTNTIQLLIDKGAKVNSRNEKGETPLHKAAHSGHLEVVELLIAKGAEVNARNAEGVTPLEVAQKREFENVVKLLRKHGGK